MDLEAEDHHDGRYWRAWSPLPPPPELQALLSWIERGFPLYLYEPL